MGQIGLRVEVREALTRKRRDETDARMAINGKRRDEMDARMAINRKRRDEMRSVVRDDRPIGNRKWFYE